MPSATAGEEWMAAPVANCHFNTPRGAPASASAAPARRVSWRNMRHSPSAESELTARGGPNTKSV